MEGEHVRLRTYLGAIVLAAVIPLLTFAVVIIRQDLVERQDLLDRGMHDTARALSLAIDGEVKASLAVLETLASSPLLDRAELETFHALAQRAMQGRKRANLNLFDLSGAALLNSSRPFDSALPNPLASSRTADSRYPDVPLGGADPVRKVLESGRPVISDLWISLVTGEPRIALGVPVMRDGRLRYVLEMAIDAEEFTRFLSEQKLPPSSVLAIVDRSGVVIARSSNAADRVGQPLAPGLARQIAASDSGSGIGDSSEGMGMYHVFARSGFTGWKTSLGVSMATLLAPQKRALAILAGGATLALILGLGAAVVIARRVTRPIAQLARSAGAISQGERVDVDGREVRELQDLHRALAAAGDAARQSAVERERRRAAEEANRHKDEFLAMLSHELRSPLAAMTNATYVLRVSEPGTPPAREARDVLDRQTRHMAKLIDELLDISRLSVGKADLALETFDLAQATTDLVADWRASGRLERHQVVLNAERAWVDADRVRIGQIVSNLLDNSLKFTPDGGIVRVDVRADETHAVITVTDAGQGVAANDLGRVFDLFAQGDQGLARPRGGMGIGLALVKRIAQMHGGTVEIASEGPGRGTVVTVRVPAVPEPAQQPVAASFRRDTGRQRVLLIEDNNDTRQMLNAALTTIGHEVREAADGAAGLAAAAAIRPDVALIDIGLPDIDGYEVARRLRAAKANENLLLIALTGYGQPEDRDRSRQAGFDAHLTKPIGVERLKQAMASLRNAS